MAPAMPPGSLVVSSAVAEVPVLYFLLDPYLQCLFETSLPPLAVALGTAVLSTFGVPLLPPVLILVLCVTHTVVLDVLVSLLEPDVVFVLSPAYYTPLPATVHFLSC